MSYTVTDDNGTIQVRASITSRAEMNELGKALANAEKKLPEETTDPVDRPFTTEDKQ